MVRYILVSIASGILFGILDAAISANPVARRLYAVYRPVARESVNVAAGIAIDLAYGFSMAGLYLLLQPSLPGQTGVVKGLSYALLAWFFRVAMGVASEWMILRVPAATLVYKLLTGLGEMLLLGLLYGLVLH
jgi:hypothetical protein